MASLSSPIDCLLLEYNVCDVHCITNGLLVHGENVPVLRGDP